MRELLAGVNLARTRRRLGVSGASKVVRLIGRRAGLRQIVGARMLRHSFATHMLQRGADIRVIQELLGHTWLTSTQVYTKVTNKHAQADFKRFHPRAA
jgi:site-specific recombinase XerD